MTPFGEEIRRLRREKGVTQKEMAAEIGVTPAYLSALEHGRRSRPSWYLVQRIITYFNIIWDDAEALQRLAAQSLPRVTLDTSGLAPEATLLANRLAADIRALTLEEITELSESLDRFRNRIDSAPTIK